jgi:hypothetical protein
MRRDADGVEGDEGEGIRGTESADEAGWEEITSAEEPSPPSAPSVHTWLSVGKPFVPEIDGVDGAGEHPAESSGSSSGGGGWGFAVQGLWSNRPGLGAECEEEEKGHIGGVRGLPRLGLVKLWNKREEILNTVAEKVAEKRQEILSTVAEKASVGGGTARTGDAPAEVRGCEPAEKHDAFQRVEHRVKLRNPLRFLGRDEWLSLVPLQVLDVSREVAVVVLARCPALRDYAAFCADMIARQRAGAPH